MLFRSGLAPLVDGGLVDGGVTVCSMSGVSGAGNKPSQASMFCECNEDIRAYKVAGHRHEPEMEHALRMVGGADVPVTFVPHLAPMDRGILSTIVLHLKEASTTEDLTDLYSRFYEGESFVRVMPAGEQPRTKDVTLTNLCDVAVTVRKGTQVVVTSAIDNLMKGAASQAVQNMNCMLGLDETLGLV